MNLKKCPNSFRKNWNWIITGKLHWWESVQVPETRLHWKQKVLSLQPGALGVGGRMIEAEVGQTIYEKHTAG